MPGGLTLVFAMHSVVFVFPGRSQHVDESSDEARHIRQLEQLLEQKESEMVIHLVENGKL